MKRRVVLHGPATMTISLPSRWIKRNSIHKGDELQVDEDGKTLIIRMDNKPVASEKATLQCAGLGEYAINTILPALHKRGYDEIEVLFSNPEQFWIIKNRIQTMLVGFEIIERTEGSCTIRNVSTNEPSEFQNFFRRAFLTALSIAEQAVKVIEGDSATAFDEVVMLEESSNRLTNYAERLLNKNPDEQNVYYYIITWLLESICDDYKHLLQHVKNSETGTEYLLAFLRRANSLLREYYQFFYKYDDKNLDGLKREIADLRAALFREIDNDPSNTPAFIHVHAIIQRISDALASTVCLNH